ncbi:MAG: TrmH family RNA methyltransferase [Patescibacteria group bacterium]|nr:TrmH family RNA methyltransferase [Patescibacteria group bacterium]
MITPEISLVLVDIRSAHNVGAIFRTADAAGVKKIYLVGHTPAPLDRFDRPVKEIAKTALGAEDSVAWEKADSVGALIANFKEPNVETIALEQSPKSVDYKKVEIAGPTAIIVGNEVDGLPEEVLGQCDVVAEIPMRGQKESLNVSVATGVFLFRLSGI